MLFETGHKVFGGKIFGPTSKTELTVSFEIIVPSILASGLVTQVSVPLFVVGKLLQNFLCFPNGKQWNRPPFQTAHFVYALYFKKALIIGHAVLKNII